MDTKEILKKYCKNKYGNEIVIKTYDIQEVKDIIDFTKKQLKLYVVGVRSEQLACKHIMSRNPKEDQENKCRLCGLPYKS